ncbi:DUF6795 domain-containing protein [uncultured Lamprocystis sp.]|uniref:DUF6795 domain-containing protein n=1 Tax=uncultured Lamprocystis sp. TaxID=543132 RepID=UPI0025D74533|nr:DUF6795 domain-containing protein [uncultured Lamprocystis sp.]
MGMFSELVLFSDVEGVVPQDGVPVEGVEILQEITYQEPGRIPSQTVKTGAGGRFTFARVTTGSGLSRVIP